MEPSRSPAGEALEPQVVHSSRGRLRVHLPQWARTNQTNLEAALRALPGVSGAEAGPLTGNVLLLFDPQTTKPSILLDQLRSLGDDVLSGHATRLPAQTIGTKKQAAHSRHKKGGKKHARISVHGLDRDPELGCRIVHRLKTKHFVRALVKPLTGHVLIEHEDLSEIWEEILAEVTHLELPLVPGEDRPEHPLDPVPLMKGTVRTVGSLIGLGFITVRRLMSPAPAISAGVGFAAHAAGVMNLVQGLPFVRRALKSVLGRHGADLTASGLGILTQTVANFSLGLIVSFAESLLFLGEVIARRAAWRRYEDRLDGVVSEEPGSVVRLESGTRVPLAARVIEGMGNAIGTSGHPVALMPGAKVDAGAELLGGPFVLELKGGEAFEPEPREVPPAATVYHRYLAVMTPATFGFTALTTLRTGSLLRFFESLLLLNPRTAVIGHESANLNCASRILRAGLTVVGSRPERIVQQPTTVLLDGPRLLARGFEVVGVLPLGLAVADDILDLVSVISTAAGSPWGNVFPTPPATTTTGGDFNGLWASATVEGCHYTLGPPEDEPTIPEAFLHLEEGGYLLELFSVSDERSFGYVALRAHLADGVADLIETCRRLGVSLELLAGTGSLTVEELGAAPE